MAACPAGSVVISGNLPKEGGKYSMYAAIIVKRWMRKPAPRPASTICCATDAVDRQRQRNPRQDRHEQREGETMSTMERILRLMAEKKASDVYLSANAPALIKINGECVPINNQILPPDAPRNLLSEVVPPDRIEELEETGELNMGVPLSGVGAFASAPCASAAAMRW
jgi:hypothetical protein